MTKRHQNNYEIYCGCENHQSDMEQFYSKLPLWSYNSVFICLSLIAGIYTLLNRLNGLLLLVYLIALLLFVFAMSNKRISSLIFMIPKYAAWAIAIAIMVFMIISAYKVYPTCGAGPLGGDRDEALELAARALLHGRYPYYELTGVSVGWNNSITPFPGAVLFAIPFVLAGCIVYQNHFWLMAFFLNATKQLASVSFGCFAFMLLTFTPTVFGETKCGGDLATNAIYVLVAGSLFLRANLYNKTSRFRILTACFLGISLASRSVFVLILPQFIALLCRHVGIRKTIKAMSIVFISAIAVTLPFYLYDPKGFTPLGVANITSRWSHLVPFTNIWIPGAGMIISIALAIKCRSMPQFYRNCAIALATPIIIVIILSNWESIIIKKESIILFWMNYIQLSIPFSVIGWVSAIYLKNRDPLQNPEKVC